MKRVAIAFSGPSNNGKTTLICKVAKKFIDDGLKVVIVKHDPKTRLNLTPKAKIASNLALLEPMSSWQVPQERHFFRKIKCK